MWVVSAVITEKLQIRCLTDTQVVDICPPIEIVYIGNGCEGYSPHLYILVRSTLTSEINIYERGSYFLQFNSEYDRNSSIGIWFKLKFRLQMKEEAKKEVPTWAELQPMTYEYLNQKIDEIDYRYPFELPTKALLLTLIIVTMIVVIVMVVACIKWWKGRKNLKQIKAIIKMFPAGEMIKHLAKLTITRKQRKTSDTTPDVEPQTLPPATAPDYELLTLLRRPQHQPKPTVIREQVEPLY